MPWMYCSVWCMEIGQLSVVVGHLLVGIRLCVAASKWTANAAVLSHTPEMDGDQERCRQGNRDAVQNVKPVQCFLAYEAGAQQSKPGVGGVGDHVDAADRQ